MVRDTLWFEWFVVICYLGVDVSDETRHLAGPSKTIEPQPFWGVYGQQKGIGRSTVKVCRILWGDHQAPLTVKILIMMDRGVENCVRANDVIRLFPC